MGGSVRLGWNRVRLGSVGRSVVRLVSVNVIL